MFFISINENRDELLPSSARQRGEFFTTDSTDVTDFICFNLLICGGLLLSSLQRRKRKFSGAISHNALIA